MWVQTEEGVTLIFVSNFLCAMEIDSVETTSDKDEVNEQSPAEENQPQFEYQVDLKTIEELGKLDRETLKKMLKEKKISKKVFEDL